MKPEFLKIDGVSVLGNKWSCPECGKRFRRKAQAQIHIDNKHFGLKKPLLSSLLSFLKRKKVLFELTNLRQIKETERHSKFRELDRK